MARAFIAAFLLAVLAASPAAQGWGSWGSGGDLKALRSRVEQRFQILPLANGVVLTPRFKAAIRSIEVTDGSIAIDGTSVTGAEMRQKLGADSDLFCNCRIWVPPRDASLRAFRRRPRCRPRIPQRPRRNPPRLRVSARPIAPSDQSAGTMSFEWVGA